MSNGVRILVVDDDPSMVKTTAAILRHKGYIVETASSGTEALDRMSSGSYHCVLSDIRMPELNGVELYRAIKAQQPDLVYILMTAYSAHDLIQEGLSEGALAALVKPVNIEELLALLARIGHQNAPRAVDQPLASTGGAIRDESARLR